MKISIIFSALHKDGSCVKVTVLHASTLETSQLLIINILFIFSLLDDLQENVSNMTHIHMIVRGRSLFCKTKSQMCV